MGRAEPVPRRCSAATTAAVHPEAPPALPALTSRPARRAPAADWLWGPLPVQSRAPREEGGSGGGALNGHVVYALRFWRNVEVHHRAEPVHGRLTAWRGVTLGQVRKVWR